jgi:hypothetical protein
MRRAIVGFMACMVWAGCATLTVSSHIERGVDFRQYATYDWGPPDNLPIGDPRLDNNPFFADRLQGAVEKALAANGYERAAGSPPDLLVHYHANVMQRFDVNAADQPYGYCYGDNCEARVVEFEEGTLVVDLIDTKTNKVVWRGWAQDTMTGVIDHQDRLDQKVDDGITKMMRRLPQGGAGR